MQVLPTDTFDDEQLESLTANLTSKQLGWLQAKAADQDVSVDHVLRSVLAAQMKQESQSLSEAARERHGDGAAPSSRSGPASDEAPPPPTGRNSSEGAPAASTSDEEASDAPSIVESLRSASERLQNLTDEEDAPDASSPGRDADDLAESAQDTLDRLRARLGRTSADDDAAVLTDRQAPSMFDMMEQKDE